jgi:penicillin-binding protein 1A
MRKKTRNNSGSLVLAACAVLIIFVLMACGSIAGDLKNSDELLNYRNAEASVVQSEDGIVLGRYFYENRTNIPFDKIPEHLVNALIATEDVRFYEHKGYDARSFFRVLVKTVMMNRKSSGGGSTITQQLAKNMFGRNKRGLFPVLRNKLTEVIMARRLEKVFSKDEILNLYLNTVSFGENVYGIEAASNRFFDKSARSLLAEESAVLVGMLKANTSYNPRLHPENSRERRNVVLRQMEKYGYLSRQAADSLIRLPLVIHYNRSGTAGSADYFLVQVKDELSGILKGVEQSTGKKWDPERDGLVIITTLNSALQRYALSAFREHLSLMQGRLDAQYNNSSGKKILGQLTKSELERLKLKERAKDRILQEVFSWKGIYLDSLSVYDSLMNSLKLLHAGFLAMDPVTGAVKAWVGGIDFKSQPYEQILARRQMASVFKPVIYAAALEDGMEPCQYLDNDSVQLSGFTDWSPENYDHSYGGKYSLSGALAHSMNIPTFSLFLKLGFEKVDSMWHRLGFSFPLDNTPSLAMGTAEASLKEVAAAYAAFANGGFTVKPYYIRSVRTSNGDEIYTAASEGERQRIITEQSCFLMNAMLQKAVREGTGIAMKSVYGVDIPLAGKTGTSQDYSDAWFAAFNPGIVIVTRVGASSRAVHFNSGSLGSGSALALPLVALTLKKVQQDPSLKDQLFVEFPELPADLAGMLDCPDFKEKNLFDKIIDIFDSNQKTYPGRERDVENRIRNFVRRICKKK